MPLAEGDHELGLREGVAPVQAQDVAFAEAGLVAGAAEVDAAVVCGAGDLDPFGAQVVYRDPEDSVGGLRRRGRLEVLPGDVREEDQCRDRGGVDAAGPIRRIHAAHLWRAKGDGRAMSALGYSRLSGQTSRP